MAEITLFREEKGRWKNGELEAVKPIIGADDKRKKSILHQCANSDHRFLLPACALMGAGLLMACDTIARVVLDPVEVPVGIIMAMLGAPFFLYLLRINFSKQ